MAAVHRAEARAAQAPGLALGARSLWNRRCTTSARTRHLRLPSKPRRPICHPHPPPSALWRSYS
eukprot:5548-Lingulodinium_polyedra.AAC.1